jgi:hypothetical protein
MEAAELKVAAIAGATVVVTRTEAASGQSPEGTRTTWVWASMRGARAVDGVVVAVAVGAEAKVPAKAAAVRVETYSGRHSRSSPCPSRTAPARRTCL